MHVLDASRVVDVVSALLDPARRAELDVENRELQERLREQHAEKVRKPLLTLEAARANRAVAAVRRPARAAVHGQRDRSRPTLAELVPYIDWQFFFHAWDLKGKFPAILDKPAARELYDDAQLALLPEIVSDRLAAGPRRLRLLAGARRRRRRRRRRDALLLPAPAGRPRRRPAEPLPRRLRRAGRRPRRRLRGRDPRRGRARRALRGRARRLPRDHRQGARRPPGRGVAPSGCTCASAASGTRPTSTCASDDLIRRALPRHPAGLRLPGLPRPQREAEAVRAARRRGRRAAP